MFNFFALGRMGVPLSLFLTGSLVLSKLVKGYDNIASFYKRKLLPLVVSAVLCTAFYYVRAILILEQPFDNGLVNLLPIAFQRL
ncbi:hypothetical protein [Collinsella sp. HCP28S3_F2]|uniref:hypothetical protein n=1 Tax=unclassified Collinsella TaxID=2637548 RepID=UPI003F88FC15